MNTLAAAFSESLAKLSLANFFCMKLVRLSTFRPDVFDGPKSALLPFTVIFLKVFSTLNLSHVVPLRCLLPYQKRPTRRASLLPPFIGRCVHDAISTIPRRTTALTRSMVARSTRNRATIDWSAAKGRGQTRCTGPSSTLNACSRESDGKADGRGPHRRPLCWRMRFAAH